MLQTAVVQAADNQFEDACQRFIDQARLLLPLNNLTIVLLPSVKDSGKVVYSWKSKAQPGAASIVIPPDSKLSSRLPSPPLSLSIYGSCGILGAVLLSTTLPQRFSRQENRLASDIVKQLAVNLENIQLRQRVQTNSWEMELADQIARIITSAPSTDDVYAEFGEALQKLVKFDRAIVSIIDEAAGVRVIKFLSGSAIPGWNSDAVRPLAGSQAEYVLATRQPLLRELPTNFGFPIDEVYRASGLRSAITVPLIYKGHVVGTLGLRSKKPHAYSQRDIVILERLASQIAPTIENSQLAEQIKANTLRARVLSEVNKILSTSSDLETLFTNLVGYLCQEIDLDQGLLSWITFNGYDIDTIVCTPGTRATTHGSSDSSEIFRSRLTVPLAYQDQIIGSFELARSGHNFTTAEQDLMHRVGRHLESAVHNMVLRHLTMRQAYRLNQRDGDAAGLASRENQDGQIERDPMNDLAHALYSPLTSIKGYTETLLQPDEDWPKEVRQEFLQTIHQAANRLDHAIRDLVIPPRRESGPTESQTRVQDLFRQFELERSSQAEVDSVHFQCDPNLPTISIDPFIFQRAIDHLIDCCISFGTGPTSAGPDHLHILAESAQDSVVISLGFSTVDAPDSTTESPIASAVETNLKTVISRNLLEGQGISLEVERPDRHSVLFRFSVPFKQTANQLP